MEIEILKIATEIEFINGTSNEACLVLLNQYYLFWSACSFLDAFQNTQTQYSSRNLTLVKF